MTSRDLWRRYCTHLVSVPDIGLTLDVSRMTFGDDFLKAMEDPMQAAFAAMDGLERGAEANPDEKRMVGHYWLRAPDLAPTKAIADEIRGTVERIQTFAADVHSGKVKPPSAAKFT